MAARGQAGFGADMKQLIDLDPANYRPHAIHGEGRAWAETNCYADVIIELVHAMGMEPNAALAFTLGIDFEGDQWSFFKFPPQDMLALFGMEIQEFNPWRDMLGHIDEQLGLGRPVLVELDSYYLPDTAGTAYQQAHVKTTVAVNKLDLENRVLGYFHGQGYYQLEGGDFEQIFHTAGLPHDRVLPPYIEYVKLRHSGLAGDALLAASLDSLRQQLRYLPEQNPFLRFKPVFEKEMEWLRSQPLESFHDYAFATLRQFGSCYELAQTYIDWLISSGESNLEQVRVDLGEISDMAKVMQLKLARSLMRNKPLPLESLDLMAELWQRITDNLKHKYL